MDELMEKFLFKKKDLADEKSTYLRIQNSIKLMKSSYEYKKFLEYVGGEDIIGFPISFFMWTEIIMRKELSKNQSISTAYAANQLMLSIMKQELPVLIFKNSKEYSKFLIVIDNLREFKSIPDGLKEIIQNNLYGNPDTITKFLEENREFIVQEELEESCKFQLWKMYLKNK